MRKADLKEIKNAFYELSDKDRSLISGKIFHFSGSSQIENLQWGEHHLFDNMAIFYPSVREVVISKYEGLDPEAKNTVESKIWRLAGSPLIGG
jgi:hypothetical protein